MHRYHDHGFVFAYIRDFEGMDSGRITANIVEGKVNKVDVVYVDDNGNKKKDGGQVPRNVVTRELPFNVSHAAKSQHAQLLALQLWLTACSCALPGSVVSASAACMLSLFCGTE